MQGRSIFKKANGAAVDSLILTFVKIVTAALGLITTKILSTQLSLQEYGTYSQAMLLVSTVTSVSILGLSDAINYFYNVAEEQTSKEKNIATIFGIQYFVGIVSGILICCLSFPICKYFSNNDLEKIILFAAWMPFLNNLISMLQVLYVSIGKAKVIAVRNFLVSTARLIIVVISCCMLKNIIAIFVLMLVCDFVQVVYFWYSFGRNKFRINLLNFRPEIIKPVLSFSIPMAVFVFTSTLSRDIDKYVIGFYSDTETLAVYSNSAKILPFDMLTAAFLTVLIPIVTRQVRSEKYQDAQVTMKAYLRIGYLLTWIMVGGAIINAKELMLFLYDDKYLPGLTIFIIYLLVDMMKFANTSLVLSAKGKTRLLMICSVCALLANFILNILTFHLFGIAGPAITTLVVTIALMIALLALSAKEINTSIWDLFDWREVILIVVEIILVGFCSLCIKKIVLQVIPTSFIVLFLVYAFFGGLMFLLNRKRIIGCLKDINKLR